MDSITQAVLGASIGVAILGKNEGNKAAIAGAIIATIPDLDVFLYLVYDSYEMLSIHRGISHSILFSIMASFLIAYVLSKIRGFKGFDYKILLIFSWVTLFTHILLDTFTAYGTQLLLPFSNRRLGFDSINVVDPIYTIPMIIGLVLSLWVYKSKPRNLVYNNWGLIISTVYLLLTLLHKEYVNNVFAHKLSKEKIEYNSLLTMPVGIANLSWYGVAKGEKDIFMQKYSIFKDSDAPFEVFPINEDYLDELDKEVADKMRWFAKGFYTVERENEKIRIYNLQVDMRGIVKQGDKKAPTVGYFEISNKNGTIEFSSGSIKK